MQIYLYNQFHAGYTDDGNESWIPLESDIAILSLSVINQNTTKAIFVLIPQYDIIYCFATEQNKAKKC